MSPTAGLIGPSVTLLSASTALVLGAKVVRDMPPKFQGTVLGGLPAAVTAAALKPVSGASTAFHTATQLATSGQVLVTGGFEQDAVLLPQGASQFVQPPSTATAVRLYSVTGTTISAGGPVTNTYKAGSCPAAGAIAGSNDGHYRPAGYEAATATLSGNQVLITGGTPTVVDTVCVDCEPSDSTYSSHYLCGLTQASLYDDTSKSLAPAPALALGRLGHQQTRLLDGNILVTGGITHPGKLANTATAEAEIYNPTSAGQGATDDNDPLAPLRKAAAPASCTPL
jgi:hypothetical protein